MALQIAKQTINKEKKVKLQIRKENQQTILSSEERLIWTRQQTKIYQEQKYNVIAFEIFVHVPQLVQRKKKREYWELEFQMNVIMRRNSRKPIWKFNSQLQTERLQMQRVSTVQNTINGWSSGLCKKKNTHTHKCWSKTPAMLLLFVGSRLLDLDAGVPVETFSRWQIFLEMVNAKCFFLEWGIV